jgi:hypothetical protein
MFILEAAVTGCRHLLDPHGLRLYQLSGSCHQPVPLADLQPSSGRSSSAPDARQHTSADSTVRVPTLLPRPQGLLHKLRELLQRNPPAVADSMSR